MVRSFGRSIGFWTRQFASEVGLAAALTAEPFRRAFAGLSARGSRALHPARSQFPPLDSLARELDLRIFAANDLGPCPPRPRPGARSADVQGGERPTAPAP